MCDVKSRLHPMSLLSPSFQASPQCYLPAACLPASHKAKQILAPLGSEQIIMQVLFDLVFYTMVQVFISLKKPLTLTIYQH